MKRYRPIAPAATLCIVTFIVVVVMIGALRLQAAGSAQAELDAIWQRVQQSGAYRFNADVEQTTTPQASLSNAGRESKQKTFHLQGTTNVAEESFHLSVWTNGGSVLIPDSGLEVRIVGDVAEARQGNGAWEVIDDFTDLFAPGGDFLSFTQAAENVINHGTELRNTAVGGFLLTHYTFDIDGRKLAEIVRRQAMEEAIADGLPATMQMDLPKAYVDMTGTGELWVDADGLPLRQQFELHFPEDEHNYQTSAAISIDFFDFAPLPPRRGIAAIADTHIVRGLLIALQIDGSSQTIWGALWLAGIFAFAVLIVVRRRVRAVYIGVIVAVIGSMVATPLLNNRQAHAYSERQAAQRASSERSQVEIDVERELAKPRFDPNLDPLFIAQAQQEDEEFEYGDLFYDPLCASDPAGDLDGDTLSNLSECLLGTLVESADSDQDDIPDNLEVTGFEHGGRTWYTNPLNQDTNNDGISDGQEWQLDPDDDGQPDDTNGNGIPDLWDDDNDGDGVRDKLDMSPYSSTHPAGPDAQIFTQDNPLELVLDDLVAGQLAEVEFQLVPTNPDHLWYSQNVLDWPVQDRKGQLQDIDGATFYDVDGSLPPNPNDNGDVRMVPMLEILISGPDTNLPPAESCTNDEGETTTCYPLLEQYGIVVQEIVTDTTYAAYVPLSLVTDDNGERNIAFYGRMLYEASGTWTNPDSVRMVWAVQMLNDICAAYEDNICIEYSELNTPQIVQVYYDDFYLSGTQVTEEHGTDLALIYEDPAAIAQLPDAPAGYDKPLYIDTLYGLMYGLNYTFLAGADCDRVDTEGNCEGNGERDITIAEIERRFNYSSNGGVSEEDRWSLPNVLRVERQQYASLDLGLLATTVTETIKLLEESYTPVWSENEPITPTVMLAFENDTRYLNLDEGRIGGTNVGWNGATLTITLAQTGDDVVQISTTAAVKWSPYNYSPAEGWQGADIRVFYDALADELAEVYAGVYDDPNERETYIYLSQIMYVGVFQGIYQNVQLTSPTNPLDTVVIITGTQQSSSNIAVTLGQDLFQHLAVVLRVTIRYTQELAEITLYFWRGQYAQGGLIRPPKFLGPKALRVAGGAGFLTGALVTIVTGVLILLVAFDIIRKYVFTNIDIDWFDSLLNTVLAIGIVIQTFIIGKLIWSAIRQFKAFKAIGLVTKEAAKAAATYTSQILNVSRAVSVAALVVSIGLAVGIFIYALASGDVEAGTIAFNELLANTIAAIIVAILFFVLAVTIAGFIILAIIALIDLILLLAGTGWSVTEGLTWLIAKTIYNYFVLQDIDVDTGQLDTEWVDPEAGIVVGNPIIYTLPITTTLNRTTSGAVFGPLYNRGLDRNSLIYSLTTQPVELKTKLDDRKNDWFVWDNNRKARIVDTPQATVPLIAGVNSTPPLTLNSGFAVNVISCWLTVICYAETVTGSDSSSLGETLVVDVLPATLDEFVDIAEWSDSRLRSVDADGDGLRATRYGGIDPDDTTWDADGDLLSDDYELTLRSRSGADGSAVLNPRARDTDGDDVNDGIEIFNATDPAQRDSDGDGIQDVREIRFFMEEDGTLSFGGWQLPYAYDPATQQTASTQIWSDPLQSDADGDGLSDLFEQNQTTIQPNPWADPTNPLVFNPNVWNESPVALYIEDATVEGYAAPDATLTYTTTTANNLGSGQELVGELSLALPGGVDGGPLSRFVNLDSGESASLVSELNFASSSTAVYDLTSRMELTNFFETRWLWDPPNSTENEILRNSLLGLSVSPVAGWSGSHLVVTRERHLSSEAIVAYVVESDGTVVDRRELRQAADGNFVTDPDVACNANGACLAVWGSYANTQGNLLSAITFMQFDGSLEDVQTFSPILSGSTTLAIYNASVATSGENFLATWTRRTLHEQTSTRVEYAPFTVNSGPGVAREIALVGGSQAAAVAWNGSSYTLVWTGDNTLSWRNVAQNGSLPDSMIYSVSGDGWPRADGSKRPPVLAYDEISEQTLFTYRSSTGRLVARFTDDDSANPFTLETTDVDGTNVTVALTADRENGGWIAAWTPAGGRRALFRAISPAGALRGDIDELDQTALTTVALACSRARALVELPFSEPAGATVFADSSGNGNDAVCDGACPQSGISGRIGNSVAFVASNQEALRVDNIHLAWRSFTLAAWVRHDVATQSSSWDTVLSLGPLDNIVFGGNVRLVTTSAGGGSMVCAIDLNFIAAPIPDDGWHHWACTLDRAAQQLTLYRDGEEAATGTSTRGFTGMGPLYIGKTDRGDRFDSYFTGAIDQVSIVDRALSPEEIEAMAEGALAAYSLDEPPGAQLFVNAIGGGLNGRCDNAATCPTLGVPGKAFTAAEFDGQDDYIAVGDQNSWLPLDNLSFTISAWAKRNVTGQGHMIVTQGEAANNRGLQFGFRPNDLFTCGFWQNDLNSSAQYTDTEWHHWVCTYDSETGRQTLYRDGNEIGSRTAPVAYGGTGSTFIGKRFNDDWYFNGVIDEVGIWQTALTADEVLTLFNKVKVVDESVLTCQLPAATGNMLTINKLALRQTTTFLGEISQSNERTVTVDGDNPAVAISADYFSQSGEPGYVRSSGTLVVAGEASDPTSFVAKVEIKPGSEPWQDAVGAGAWSYRWTTAGLPDGPQTLELRAMDAVGNGSGVGAWTTILDNTPPAVAMDDPGSAIRPYRDVQGRWRVPLRGTVADPAAGSRPGSGLAQAEVLLHGGGELAGLGWQEVAVAGDGSWSLDYVLPTFDDQLDNLIDPSGVYTATMRAQDVVGNETPEADYPTRIITLDAAGPVVEASLALSDTLNITVATEVNGTITDASAIAAVEVNLTPANQMGALDGLALHLPFDELGAAETFVDESGSGHDVTCASSHCPTVGQPGRRAGAFRFDGVGEYLNGRALLDPAATPFSAAVWFKVDKLGSPQFILQQRDGAGTGRVWLTLTPIGKVNTFLGGSDLNSQTQITPDAWHHAAITYDGSILRLYVDGVLDTSSARTLEASNGEMFIGANKALNSFYAGLLDELVVYDRALADYEVANLYAYGLTPWLPAALDGNAWRYAIGEGPQNGREGFFQLNVRGVDALGNVTQLDGQRVWRGEIDTKPPVVAFPVTVHEIGSTVTTTYACHATDFNLNGDMGCNVMGPAPGYRPSDISFTPYADVDPWYASVITDTARLYAIDAERTVDRALPNLDNLRVEVCDLYQRCTTAPAEVITDPLRVADGEVLRPSDHAVLTSTETISITGVAYAETGLETLVVRVDGKPTFVDYWATDAVTEDDWSFTWTPPGEGVFEFVPEIDDWAGATPAVYANPTATDEETTAAAPSIEVPELPPAIYLPLMTNQGSPLRAQPAGQNPMELYLPLIENVVAVTAAYTGTTTLIYVDLAPPTISISPTVLTAADRIAPQTVLLGGAAADSVLLHEVEVRVGTGEWVRAGLLPGERWSIPWTFDGSSAGATIEVAARAVDIAGRTTTVTEQLTVDLTPPTPGDIILSYVDDAGGTQPVAPGQQRLDATALIIVWAAAADADEPVTYEVGFGTSNPPADGDLTRYDAPGEHSASVSPGQRWYATVRYVDDVGNVTTVTQGPLQIVATDSR